MREIGMFEAKTHFSDLVKHLDEEGTICITNRNKEVAFIVSVEQFYRVKQSDSFKQLQALRKRAPLGSADEVVEMRDEGRK